MNAIDLLKEDHRRVETLFAQFRENENGTNGALFKKIRDELLTHAHIEEKVFYPDLLKRGKKDLKAIVREGLEEHGQVKKLLSELDKMTPRNKAFNPKLKVVVEDVEHHVEEEEGDMFDMAEDQLTESRLETLGAEMETEKARFQKRMGIKPSREPQIKKGVLDTVMETTKDLVTGAFLASDESKPSARKTGKGNGSGEKRSSGSGNGGGRSSRSSTGAKNQRSRTKASSSARGSARGR
ncbi:MAG: hemerythrin domain-containing protein [Acidobacteria bacterium]|nr:hemerythrin domain-containing protein [Acidobacteriota bacterium]